MKKEKSPKKSSFYYILGSVILLVSAIIFIVLMTLPLALKGSYPDWLGIVSIIFITITFVSFLFGIYLLKKGTFVKLNSSITYKDEIDNEVEDEKLRKIDKEIKDKLKKNK